MPVCIVIFTIYMIMMTCCYMSAPGHGLFGRVGMYGWGHWQRGVGMVGVVIIGPQVFE